MSEFRISICDLRFAAPIPKGPFHRRDSVLECGGSTPLLARRENFEQRASEGAVVEVETATRMAQRSVPFKSGGEPPHSRTLSRTLNAPWCLASGNRHSKISSAFTLLEIILALALVGLVLVGMNTFVFSMTELWGKNADIRLFDQHVRAVTRFLDEELRSASLPPSAAAGTNPITAQEIRPKMGSTDNLLTFELTDGCRLFTWPDRPLPEVVCSLQVRDREGLKLLWHSRLEKRFNDDPPRETLVSPLVTGLSYDYYDTNFRNWKNETQIRRTNGNQLEVPQRLRLKFTYKKMTRETVVTLPSTPQALPNF